MDNLRRGDNWKMRERHEADLELVASKLTAVSDFCMGVGSFQEKRKNKTTAVPSIPAGDEAA